MQEEAAKPPAMLEKLTKMGENVRIGGKGSARRKKKVVTKSAVTDDKKLQGSLKKQGLTQIANIEEVNMFKDDGSVLHFKSPKVQASLAANTVAVTGPSETKSLTEMLPTVLNQLGSLNLQNLQKIAEDMQKNASAAAAKGGAAAGEGAKKAEQDNDEGDDEDLPELVEDFDAQSKLE